MTKDETLDWLYRLKSEIFVYMPRLWLIPMGDALDMAIKALEQEPILNKIRTEIKREIDRDDHADEYCDGYYDGMRKALAIIDKYKAGSGCEEE